MTKRHAAPLGAPCWVDLWTSDIEGSRELDAGLFGRQAGEPRADHGGYFRFTRAGIPIAGAMGDMGEARADNTWKPFSRRTILSALSSSPPTMVPPCISRPWRSTVSAVKRRLRPGGSDHWNLAAREFPGFTVMHEQAPRASSPSTSTTTTRRSPSIATCSAGIHWRKRPTAIATPATWTPRITGPSLVSATRWSL